MARRIKAILLLIAFAILTNSSAATVNAAQSENASQEETAYDAIANDIREHGAYFGSGQYTWGIQRIDDMDETRYILELTERAAPEASSITCSHVLDGRIYTLEINKSPNTSFSITVRQETTLSLIASGTIDPETFTGTETIDNWTCEDPASSEISEAAKSETSLLVQLLQTNLVGEGRTFVISDLGFTAFHLCSIHSPGLRLVTKMPTCSAGGLCEYDCQICGAHIIEPLPSFRPENQLDEDHDWVYESIATVQEAPHESTAHYHCAACGTQNERFFCACDVFADMPSRRKWSHNAIEWAYLNGLTKGTSSTKFSPKGKCTRAEIITQLWRAAGSPVPTITESPFQDIKKGSYYETPVLWAYENGITTGTGPTKFSPKMYCTRAQIIMFIWKSKGCPQPELTDEQFDDVDTHNYYYRAVLWALENGITSGISNSMFGSNEQCTREQAAGFLYFSFRH